MEVPPPEELLGSIRPLFFQSAGSCGGLFAQALDEFGFESCAAGEFGGNGHDWVVLDEEGLASGEVWIGHNTKEDDGCSKEGND